MDVQVAISSANSFSSLQILDVRFCTAVGGTSHVLGEGWKSAFARLFVFTLAGPTAPTRVERRNFGSSVQALEVVLGLALVRGLVAKFLTAISLMDVVPTEEKSKKRSNAKSFCN